MRSLRPHALASARALAARFSEQDAVDLIRAAATESAEHTRIEALVFQVLEASVSGTLLETLPRQFDWEGRTRRSDELQDYSYALLGTDAHPDAAILSPFSSTVSP